MICQKCNMTVGPEAVVCPNCQTKIEHISINEADGNSEGQEVDEKTSVIESLQGEKRLFVTSKGARLGLLNTSIATEITYDFDGMHIQQRPNRGLDDLVVPYADITSIKTKRTMNAYYISLFVLGIVGAFLSAGTGLLLSIVALICGRDYVLVINRQSGNAIKIVTASSRVISSVCTELESII